MIDLEKKKILEWCGLKPDSSSSVDTCGWILPTGEIKTYISLDVYFCFKYAIPRLQKEWGLVNLIWDYGAWDICLGAFRGQDAFHLGKETGETYEKLEDAFGQLILKLVEIDKERLA